MRQEVLFPLPLYSIHTYIQPISAHRTGDSSPATFIFSSALETNPRASRAPLVLFNLTRRTLAPITVTCHCSFLSQPNP